MANIRFDPAYENAIEAKTNRGTLSLEGRGQRVRVREMTDDERLTGA